MQTPLAVFLVSSLVFSALAAPKKPCGDSLPIVYSPQYNISLLGIEYIHPFDPKKYGKVYQAISRDNNLCPQQFFMPTRVADSELLLVHTPAYLDSLKTNSGLIARVGEMSFLSMVSAPYLYRKILEPMRLATGGTILGGRLALRYGWAINLGGGYHNASSDRGQGLSFFADVPIAVHSLWKETPDLKVLIIDLDAHLGDGNARILGRDPRVAIFDMFDKGFRARDSDAVKLVKYPVRLEKKTATSTYLDSLNKWLPVVLDAEKPGLIVYNAGTDIYEKDWIGEFSVSREGILTRDTTVFFSAFRKKIPILMVLSGGYDKKSWEIITRSVNAILSDRLGRK
jgi:histone deacetylase 11